MVATITGMGARTSNGPTSEVVGTSLDSRAERLSGETFVVVLLEAVLGDVVGTEVNVAGVTTTGNN